MEYVWIFNGENGRFPSGVFTSLVLAESWIVKHQLSGIVTRYPLNTGVYNWAVENSSFKVRKPEHTTPDFIARFSSAGQEHYHYENGKRA